MNIKVNIQLKKGKESSAQKKKKHFFFGTNGPNVGGWGGVVPNCYKLLFYGIFDHILVENFLKINLSPKSLFFESQIYGMCGWVCSAAVTKGDFHGIIHLNHLRVKGRCNENIAEGE